MKRLRAHLRCATRHPVSAPPKSLHKINGMSHWRTGLLQCCCCAVSATAPVCSCLINFNTFRCSPQSPCRKQCWIADAVHSMVRWRPSANLRRPVRAAGTAVPISDGMFQRSSAAGSAAGAGNRTYQQRRYDHLRLSHPQGAWLNVRPASSTRNVLVAKKGSCRSNSGACSTRQMLLLLLLLLCSHDQAPDTAHLS